MGGGLMELHGTLEQRGALEGGLLRTAGTILIDAALSLTSQNPVQNKAVAAALVYQSDEFNGDLSDAFLSCPKKQIRLTSGGINSNGSNTSSTTRIRTVGINEFFPKVELGDLYNVKSPYEARVAIYNSLAISSSSFVTFLNDWKTGNIFIPEEYVGKYAAITIRKIGHESDDISADVATITDYVSYYNPAALNTIDKLRTIGEDGSAEAIVWEQGTISGTTGADSSSTTRIRTKYKLSYDSLRYLFVHCPEGWKFTTRIYVGNLDLDYYDSLPFTSGDKIIEPSGPYVYRFVLAQNDDSTITPSDLPEDFSITPVYRPAWEEDSTGNSIGAFVTARNNPLCVSEMLAVAKTYFDHRNDETDGVHDMVYGNTTVLDSSEYVNTIDCSALAGLILRGIPYEQTPYYTKAGRDPQSYLPNPDYKWAMDPYDYSLLKNLADTAASPVRKSASLAQWLINQGRRVPMDEKYANIEPGDLLFWANDSKAYRFGQITHTAICYNKRRVTNYSASATYKVGDAVVYDSHLYTCSTAISTPEAWNANHWTSRFPNNVWDVDVAPFYHMVIQAVNATPCVQLLTLEYLWGGGDHSNDPSFCVRPDLGAIAKIDPLSLNYGAANAGKILVVGSDGNVELADRSALLS